MDLELGPKSRRYHDRRRFRATSAWNPSWSPISTAIRRTSPTWCSHGRSCLAGGMSRRSRRRSEFWRQVPRRASGPHLRRAPSQGLCRVADLGRVGTEAWMTAVALPASAALALGAEELPREVRPRRRWRGSVRPPDVAAGCLWNVQRLSLRRHRRGRARPRPRPATEYLQNYIETTAQRTDLVARPRPFRGRRRWRTRCRR